MARLYADEQFPYEVVEHLRDLGHDVVTVAQQLPNLVGDRFEYTVPLKNANAGSAADRTKPLLNCSLSITLLV